MEHPSPPERRLDRTMIVILVVVLALCALVFVPVVINQQRTAAYQQAVNNSRPIRFSLFEFAQEYGSFPSEEARTAVEETTGADLGPWTGTANDCFRQLVASGIHSEDIFFAVHPEGSHPPDGIIAPLATEALQPGEAGFSYVYGLRPEGPPETPVLLAPMRTGTQLAHPTAYGGRVAVRLLDGSALPCTVNSQGVIFHPNGSGLLDPSQPWWQGRPIDIRHPEFPH